MPEHSGLLGRAVARASQDSSFEKQLVLIGRCTHVQIARICGASDVMKDNCQGAQLRAPVLELPVQIDVQPTRVGLQPKGDGLQHQFDVRPFGEQPPSSRGSIFAAEFRAFREATRAVAQNAAYSKGIKKGHRDWRAPLMGEAKTVCGLHALQHLH